MSKWWPQRGFKYYDRPVVLTVNRADSITYRKQQENITGTKVAKSSLPLPSVSVSGTDSVSCLWRSHILPGILLHYLVSVTHDMFTETLKTCYIETKSFVLLLLLFSCNIKIKFNLHCLCNGPLFRGLLLLSCSATFCLSIFHFS